MCGAAMFPSPLPPSLPTPTPRHDNSPKIAEDRSRHIHGVRANVNVMHMRKIHTTEGPSDRVRACHAAAALSAEAYEDRVQ